MSPCSTFECQNSATESTSQTCERKDRRDPERRRRLAIQLLASGSRRPGSRSSAIFQRMGCGRLPLAGMWLRFCAARRSRQLPLSRKAEGKRRRTKPKVSVAWQFLRAKIWDQQFHEFCILSAHLVKSKHIVARPPRSAAPCRPSDECAGKFRGFK